jgi:ribosomal protein L29
MMIKAEHIRGLTKEERKDLLKEKQNELMELRVKQARGFSGVSTKKVKREIARIKTIMKELEENN